MPNAKLVEWIFGLFAVAFLGIGSWALFTLVDIKQSNAVMARDIVHLRQWADEGTRFTADDGLRLATLFDDFKRVMTARIIAIENRIPGDHKMPPVSIRRRGGG